MIGDLYAMGVVMALAYTAGMLVSSWMDWVAARGERMRLEREAREGPHGQNR